MEPTRLRHYWAGHRPKTVLDPVTDARTLSGLLSARAARSPETTAYRWFDEPGQIWRAMTWMQAAGESARRQRALLEQDLRFGDRIATLLPNGPEWVLYDQAGLGLGLVTVALPPRSPPDYCVWAVSRVGARLLLADGTNSDQLHSLEIAMPPAVRILPVFPGNLARRCGSSAFSAPAERLADRARPDDLASIVFTSGTAGRPKGVMLTHRNILSNAAASLARIAAFPDDRFLSLLPLCHMLERTVGYYLPIMAGAQVAFARGPRQLKEDLSEVRPSILLVVPRVLERIAEAAATGSAMRRRLLAVTAGIGWEHFEWLQRRTRWRPGLLCWSLLRLLFPRSLRRALGGNLRLVICGGAPLMRQTARILIGLGMPVIQGYGLTETSPVVCTGTLDDNDPESVGSALDGVEIRLADDGELLVRGPGVMRGYWEEAEATAHTIDGDGWLRTGDLARIAAGRIFIVGRRKDIIVLSTGEKVHPAALELAISEDPLFHQVLVCGDGKPFLVALVVLGGDEWRRYLRAAGRSHSEAMQDDAIREKLLSRIARRLRQFPDHAQVRKAAWLTEPWSVESDLLTYTLKARRAKILERYADLIEGLYGTGKDS